MVDEDPDGDGIDVVMNVRFPGQYFDQEIGLHYNQFRYYDPATGRYLTADPIGQLSGPNLYTYVGNNPLLWVDPLGLAPSWVSPASAVIGATGGTLVAIGYSTGNVYAGIAGLTLVAVAGGLQIWDTLTTPIEQINRIMESEDMGTIKDNMEQLQDLLNGEAPKDKSDHDCP
jgi:RHS repeat-associated protein